MKNQIIGTLCMLAISFTSLAQQSKSALAEGEVSKSLYGIQIGLLSIHAHNEFRIGATASLRVEAGVQFEGASYRFSNDELYAFPVFSVEPRYYYNLDRRLSKGKSIDKNNGNFLSLLVKASTGRSIDFGGVENRKINEDYGVYVRWGLKRTFGKHFTMETAVGPGIVRSYSTNATELSSDIDLMFRIGYTF